MNRNDETKTMTKKSVLIINIADLQEGMKFDAPVFFEGDNLFVASGLAIRSRDIRKLELLGVKTVRTEGSLIQAASNTPLGKTRLHLFAMQQKETRCLKEYADLLEKSRNLFSFLAKKEPVEKTRIDDIVHRIFHWTKDYPKEMIQIIHGIEIPADDLASNALHTAVIATIMALQKKLLSHDILSLATAGFLHDIGMLRIPATIRNKKGKLDERESEIIKTHPFHSHAMMRNFGYPPGTADIVLSHHERMDGRGYPRKIAGKDIHEHALIVAVADAYAALINRRPYRRHLLGHDALKTILHGIGHQYSADIVKLLLKSIGIYPLGSIVLLSNYSVGRVIETGEETALRPKVEIIRDKYGQSVTPPHRIDLVEKSDLYIVKALNPQDLAS